MVSEVGSTCQFGTLQDEMLRDRLMIGINDNSTRARLLRESSLSLTKAVDVCRSSEIASKHLLKMERNGVVHHVKSKAEEKQRKPFTCNYCGDNHPLW